MAYFREDESESELTPQEILRIVREELDEDSLRKIAQRAIGQAATGDHRARDWLSAFIIGRPVGLAPLPGEQELLREADAAFLEMLERRYGPLRKDLTLEETEEPGGTDGSATVC